MDADQIQELEELAEQTVERIATIRRKLAWADDPYRAVEEVLELTADIQELRGTLHRATSPASPGERVELGDRVRFRKVGGGYSYGYAIKIATNENGDTFVYIQESSAKALYPARRNEIEEIIGHITDD